MKKCSLFVFLFVVFSNGIFCEEIDYSEHQLWRLNLKNNEQVGLIRDLTSRSYRLGINFWSEEFRIGVPIDFSVAPKSILGLKEFLDFHKIEFQVTIENIGEIIRQQKEIHRTENSQLTINGFAYDKYHPLDEISSWIDQMVQTYPSLASSFVVGESYEKRQMKVLKISSSQTAQKLDGTPVNKKKAVWWDGGIHAREWISPATVIYIAHALLSNYSVDPTITHLVDQFDYYILPVFNVDGYAFTWSSDRLWRKTRSKTSDPTCFGADPNRNWDYHWCEGGASPDPCDETYCGSKAFSEVETVQVAKFLGEHNDSIVHYINFHSYSQLWMSPWGYTTAKPPEFKLQDEGSVEAVAALRSVFGTRYEHGNIGSAIYIASGNTVDWTSGTANIKLSYAVELRDTGEFGFLLPENQILPSGKETLAAEIALLKYVEKQIYA